MTLNERIRVVKLTKALFPTEVERYDTKDCDPQCATCLEQIAEWNALLWRVYNALIETEFSI